MLLARNFPNNKAADFLDWFTYSDNTIDGQSRKKAYTLLISNALTDKIEDREVFMKGIDYSYYYEQVDE